MPIQAAPAAALWSAALIALLLVLSVLVVRQRRRHKVAIGHGDQPSLEAAIRAFGNAAEYVPTCIGALAILALVGAPPLIVHLVGGIFFAGRAIHAFGLSRSAGLTRGRVIGMMFTWIAYLFAAVALLLYAVA